MFGPSTRNNTCFVTITLIQDECSYLLYNNVILVTKFLVRKTIIVFDEFNDKSEIVVVVFSRSLTIYKSNTCSVLHR